MSHTSLSAAGAAAGHPVPFACSWKDDGFRSVWVHLEGELDLAVVAKFQAVLQEAQRSAGTVSIDLQELGFIDCAALKVIVDANAAVRQEGNQLILVRGYGQVDRVLQLTGLLDLVEVVDLQTVRRPAGADKGHRADA
jgi:anti-anti-sigma factor